MRKGSVSKEMRVCTLEFFGDILTVAVFEDFGVVIECGQGYGLHGGCRHVCTCDPHMNKLVLNESRRVYVYR